MNSTTQIKIKLAEELAKTGHTLMDLEEVLQSMKTAEAQEIVGLSKKADPDVAEKAIGLAKVLALPAGIAMAGGAALGYGAHAANRAFQGSTDNVDGKRKQIDSYRQAIKDLHP